MPHTPSNQAQTVRGRDTPGGKYGRARVRYGKSAADSLDFALPRGYVPCVDLPEGVIARLVGSDEIVLRAFLETLARKRIVGLDDTTCFSRGFASKLTLLDEAACQASIRRLRALGLMRWTTMSVDTGGFYPAKVYTAPAPLLDDLPTTTPPFLPSAHIKETREKTNAIRSQMTEVFESLEVLSVQGLTTVHFARCNSRLCAVCESDISHRRADAVTCSAKCRMRLSRQ